MSENIRVLFQDQTVQPEVVKAMGDAYDLAAELAPDGVNREAIARAILSAARAGERDPMRLCDAALNQLRPPRPAASGGAT